jgi:deoxyribodipyrimidine photolyase
MKRDFRITDNECLFEAAQHADMVLPFFCWEHDVINEGDYSSFHLQAQWEGLSGICQSLRSRGIESRVVSGEIVEIWLLFSGIKMCKNGVGNGM